MLWLALVAGCGRFSFDPAGESIAFELTVTCGELTPTTSDLVVDNPFETPLVITGVDETTGGFSIATALPITIAPGGDAAIAIRPPVAVIGTDRAGVTKAGSITLASNAGPLRVALTAEVIGANVEITDSAKTPVPFALVGAGGGACPAPAVFFLTNSGNAPITLDGGSATNLIINGFSGGTLDPDDSASFSVSAVTSAACTGTGSITYQVTGPLCTTSPAVLQATFDIPGSSTCSCS